MLARTCLWLLGGSTLFPIVASLTEAGALPLWIGVLDVVVATIVVIVALTLTLRTSPASTAGDWQESMRLARVAVAAIPLLLAMFFLAGSRVRWQVLVIGLAWRAWLLVFIAPQLAVALRERRVASRTARDD